MSDDELIEKAAKAILDASDVQPDDTDGDHGYYAKTWHYAVQDARAALAVFREHTAPEFKATVAPFGYEATSGMVQDVWDAFVKPGQSDDAPPQSAEMRVLMGILRAVFVVLEEQEGEGDE